MEINPIEETEEDLMHASKEYPFIIKAGNIPDCCLNYANLVPIWLYICGGAELGYVTAQELIFQCKSCGKYILAKVFNAKDDTCYVTQENSREVVLRGALTDTLGRAWYMFKIPRSLYWDELKKFYNLKENKRFSFNIANGELMSYPDMKIVETVEKCEDIPTCAPSVEKIEVLDETTGNTTSMPKITTSDGEVCPPIMTPEELIDEGKEVLNENITPSIAEMIGLTNGELANKLSRCLAPEKEELPMVNRYLKKLALGEPLDAQDLIAKQIYELIESTQMSQISQIEETKEDVELEDVFNFKVFGHVEKACYGHLGYTGKVDFNEIYCKSISVEPETDREKNSAGVINYMHVQDGDPKLLGDLKNRSCLRLKNAIYPHVHETTKKEYWVYVDELVITVHNKKMVNNSDTNINMDISIGPWKKRYIKIADMPNEDGDDFEFDTEFPNDDTDGVHTELNCGKDGYNENDGDCARCRNKECDD